MSSPTGVPKNMTTEQLTERGRNAALSRTTLDHHLNALVGKPLSDAQRARLADLLRVATSPAMIRASREATS